MKQYRYDLLVWMDCMTTSDLEGVRRQMLQAMERASVASGERQIPLPFFVPRAPAKPTMSGLLAVASQRPSGPGLRLDITLS